jgi:hypothetical protein
MIRRLTLLLVMFAGIFFGTVALPAASVSAASAANCGGGSVAAGGRFLNFPTWYKYLNPTFVDGECRLDFEFPDDIGKVLLAVVEILLRVAGLVAVGFVVYGGVRYVLSLGNPESTKNARGTIINALIGLIIAASATAIVNLVAGNLI